MSKSRKTIDVSYIRDAANYFLENSAPELVANREATANLPESALHETGNYKGFRYLDAKWRQVAPFDLISGDESRRFYN